MIGFCYERTIVLIDLLMDFVQFDMKSNNNDKTTKK